MRRSVNFVRDQRRRIDLSVDSLIYGLSVCAVPIAVVVVTLIAFFAWERQFPESSQTSLEIRVLEQASDELAPEQALVKLSELEAVGYQDTNLSESAFWFSFVARPIPDARGVDVELPSRHATEAICWNAEGLNRLGHATRASTTGQIKAVKAGFAVALGKIDVLIALS